MKKFYLSFLPFLLFSSMIFSQGREVIVAHLVRTADVNHPVPGWVNVPSRNQYGIIKTDSSQVNNNEYAPPLLYPSQRFGDGSSPVVTSGSAPVISQNSFDGMGYTQVCPADPNMAVGNSYIIQMINGASGAYLQIYNKPNPVSTNSTPTVAVKQIYLDAITGKGGLGDPIVLYDPVAKSFILTELANKRETGSNGLVISVVSELNLTSTSRWHSYYVATSLFPDYPKYGISYGLNGVGYLYFKTNDFKGNSYNGASVYAAKLSDMYSGLANVAIQHYSLGKSNKYFSMCPVRQVDTNTPAFTEGGLFAYINPAAWNGTGTDYVGIVQLIPGTGVTDYAISSSHYSLPASTVPQPGGGQNLDALAGRVMNSPVMRILKDGQHVVFAFTVGTNTGDGLRWYDLKVSNAQSFVISQQSTFDISDNNSNYRWMPSVSMDGNGNVGLGYNVVNPNDNTNGYPSIRVVGALSPSSGGTTSYTPEQVMTQGTNASSCYGRYGDYNSVVIDPSDNTTFWCTAMYNNNSDNSWSTSIGAFTVSSGGAGLLRKGADNRVAETPGNLNPSINAAYVNAVYPNPVHSVLTVQLAKVNNNTQLQLYDLNGRMLQRQWATGNVNTVNVSGLAPAIYLLKVVSTDKVIVRKIVKE
jgi:hypothetical protein